MKIGKEKKREKKKRKKRGCFVYEVMARG